MKHFKKGKAAVAALLALSLAACANNGDQAFDNGTNNNRTMNTGSQDHNQRGILNNGGTGRDNGSLFNGQATGGSKEGNNGGNNGGQNATGQGNGTEILQLQDGYITIDPNSFSTATPSDRFPHLEFTQQGWYRVAPDPQEGLAQPGQGQQGQPQQEQGGQPEQGQGGQQSPAGGQQNDQANQGGQQLSQLEQQVIELTNQERRKHGLSALTANIALAGVAQQKSNDMQTNNYFSHTSPTYGSPFDMMRDFGISYTAAGENIAMGQQSAQQVVNDWTNSEGHRKNILSPQFTHIGVGHSEDGNYWTQMFIGK